MKTIERMMYAVHRKNLESGERYGAIYVAETPMEAERWLARELRENPHLKDFGHEIKYEKWNWHK